MMRKIDLRNTLGAGILLVISVGLGAAAGCSKSSDSMGAAPVSEDEFKKDLASEHCSRVALCCQASSQPFSQDKCVEQYIATTFPSAPDAGADAGTSAPAVAYDATAATACLAEIKALPMTCESLFPATTMGPPSQGPILYKDRCSAIYRGQRGVGSSCSSTSECTPGADGWAYCNMSLGYLVDAGAGMGVCQPVQPVLAGSCGDSTHSPTDPSIKPFSVCPSGPCDNMFCHPISGKGETCKQFSGYVCGADLKCDGAVCVALPGAGEACPDGTCASAAYCDGTSKTCKAKKASGDACSGSDECALPDQCGGGKCAVNGAAQCTMGH